MTAVEIEYCHPCGFLNRAEDVQHVLLQTFGQEIESVTLKTGDHGVFVVRVDGDPVFDKSEDEFDVDEIVRNVQSQL
ncbi:SelT/SelW/SelH family protein [Haloarchaeobius sp. DFWS5]|uniref:SelT/SelW/SelH family protein n=1 Tax=Haloarchaeobius sp. DFWS5 TaxID=3446114 RepID=UPI003EB88310